MFQEKVEGQTCSLVADRGWFGTRSPSTPFSFVILLQVSTSDPPKLELISQAAVSKNETNETLCGFATNASNVSSINHLAGS